MINTLSYVKDKLMEKIDELRTSEYASLHDGEIMMCCMLLDLVNEKLGEVR